MDYNSIERIPNEVLDPMVSKYDKAIIDDKIIKIVTFYLPQINKLLEAKSFPPKTIDNLSIKSGINLRPHILSKDINLNGCFSFSLDEQVHQCGILVSHYTNTYYSNIGLGTFIHAIKEDIAYVTGYSYLMYTDSVFDTIIKCNEKIMKKIGAKEVFRGTNTRSSNKIAIWIKDLTEYYSQRVVNKQIEQVETVTL